MNVYAESGGKVGPKTKVSGQRAVVSSQHPLVTDAMTAILEDGGNAADAAIAGALVHGVVQPEMTNFTGSISLLYYDSARGEFHELNSWGTLAPDLPPFRRVLGSHGDLCEAGREPCAAVPGFMPGIKALYERFGTLPWRTLCGPAIHWAAEGHEVTSLQHRVLATEAPIFLHTRSGREFFAPEGHLVQVGDRWRKPDTAETLTRLSESGPDYFISGGWAEHFAERGRELGWAIDVARLGENAPRWGQGARYEHRGHEILQLSPPETQAVRCSMVLDMLSDLGIPEAGHWSRSAESLYFLAHALRRARFETGYINDPHVFDVPWDTLMSKEFHTMLAEILRTSTPKKDLTDHMRLTSPMMLSAAGGRPFPPGGSCETSVVDQQGNWIQMMNTLQSGGIPGEVVDGVPMVGSHVQQDMSSWISGWLVPGSRMRGPMGNTFVIRDGKPWLALGTPGTLWATVVQVLSNVLDFGMDPETAVDAPRLLELGDQYVVQAESRLEEGVVDGLAAKGVLVDPLEPYSWHLGSFQVSWRTDDGVLHAVTDPRREGKSTAL